MGYKYVYKRGDERNPITDYHKKYIEVGGTRVMTTRYTYEIALSKHWPDHSECTGPRGGKAVREFARYVWYANGMFYAVKRQLVGENKFGNTLVPLSGVIWDCHSKQSESQGIPVVEITLKDGKPVSVLMDDTNVEVTKYTWPIAEELLYLNGARCPRSPNKQPSKPRKRRAAKRVEPKVARPIAEVKTKGTDNVARRVRGKGYEPYKGAADPVQCWPHTVFWVGVKPGEYEPVSAYRTQCFAPATVYDADGTLVFLEGHGFYVVPEDEMWAIQVWGTTAEGERPPASEVERLASVWLSNMRSDARWLADYCKRMGKTREEVVTERNAIAIHDNGAETVGTYDGYRLTRLGDRYTVRTPWDLTEGLGDYESDEVAIERLMGIINTINELEVKAAA